MLVRVITLALTPSVGKSSTLEIPRSALVAQSPLSILLASSLIEHLLIPNYTLVTSNIIQHSLESPLLLLFPLLVSS